MINNQTRPFPGLRSYNEDEDYLFFGRESHLDELLKKLKNARFLSVIGVSGSGKSSLVKCGLLPSLYSGYLTDAGSSWRVCMMRQGMNPVGNLAKALAVQGILLDEPEDIYPAIIETNLRRSNRGIIETAREAKFEESENLIIVVDQFEEIFTFLKQEKTRMEVQRDSALFINLLISSVQQAEIPIYVVVTMRANFLGDCAEFRGLPELINNGQFLIPKMTRQEIRSVIEGPLAIMNVEISQPLVNQILNDISDVPEYLPVLQFTLFALWNYWQKNADNEKPIDLDHYNAIGKVKNALHQTAENAYSEIKSIYKLRACDLMLRSLMDSTLLKDGIKRAVPLHEIAQIANSTDEEIIEIIETFRKEGRELLHPPEGIELTNNSVIELSHESLMRIWKRMRLLAEEELEARQIYLKLSAAAKEYETSKGKLLKNPQLQLALNWRSSNKPNEHWADRYESGFKEAMSFLNYSKDHYRLANSQQRKFQQFKYKRTKIFATSISIIAIIAVVLAIVAQINNNKAGLLRQTAEKNLKISSANNFVLQANEIQNDNPTLALRLAEHAKALFDNDNITTALKKIYSNYAFYNVIAQSENIINNALFFGNDKTILTTSTDNNILLWNSNKTSPEIFAFHKMPIKAIDISSDQKFVFTATASQAILWDDKGNKIAEINEENIEFEAVAIFPDNKMLLTSTAAGQIILWNIAGEKICILENIAKPANAIAVSPDGNNFAFVENENLISVWNSNGTFFKSFKAHSNTINKITFANNNSKILSASNDKTAIITDIKSGEQQHFIGHLEAVTCVAFSPDDKYIATGSTDNSIKIWNKFGIEIMTLKGAPEAINSVKFSKNATKILCSSNENIARIWNLEGNQQQIFIGHSNEVIAIEPINKENQLLSAAKDGNIFLWKEDAEIAEQYKIANTEISALDISADYSMLIFATGNAKVILWSFEKGKILEIFAHTKPINSVAFAPDMQHFITTSADSTAKLWDIKGNLKTTFIGHKAEVNTAIFSPDSKEILTASDDNSIKRWTLSGELVKNYAAHTDHVSDICFAPDGKSFISVSHDQTAILWNLESEILQTFVGHKNKITAVDFSSDGKFIVTGSLDKTACLWDLEGNQQQFFTGHNNYISDVKFSITDKYIYTASADNKIRLWQIKPPVESFLNNENVQELSFEEKLKYEILSPTELEEISSFEEQIIAAKYFYNLSIHEKNITAKINNLKKRIQFFKKAQKLSLENKIVLLKIYKTLQTYEQSDDYKADIQKLEKELVE